MAEQESGRARSRVPGSEPESAPGPEAGCDHEARTAAATGGEFPFTGAGQPSLAIVVPTLDEALRLPRLLDRLTAAGAEVPEDRPDQLVVVDGGSRDGTPELARAHPAVSEVLTSIANRGTQLALGAAATRADLVLFLHADCLPSPGALARLRATFADPDVVATGFAPRITAEGRFYRALERWRRSRIARGSVYGDSGLAVRTTLYRELGGHRPWPLFEDLDLSKRLARRGSIRVVPDAVLHVDARRWEARGPLRTTFRNRMLYLGYRLGVTPARLARFYSSPPRQPATPLTLPESDRP